MPNLSKSVTLTSLCGCCRWMPFLLIAVQVLKCIVVQWQLQICSPSPYYNSLSLLNLTPSLKIENIFGG